MDRIFFYSNINIDDPSIGITKKVLSQIETLREMGYDVYYTGYIKEGVAVFNNLGEIVFKKGFPTKNIRVNRYLRRWTLLKLATEFIEKTQIKFKYGYLRFHFFDRSYLKLLKALKKKLICNIVEAHAYPYKSDKLSSRTLIYIIDSIYTPLVRKYVDLVAGICDAKNIWGIETVNIDNAINLRNVTPQSKTRSAGKTLRIFSVANETRFHRYDKIINGLYEYYQNGGERKIILNLVGEYLIDTKNLIKKYDLDDNVVFYGKLIGRDLDEVYNISDIGLGAFSNRKNETTGSCIKTKEYFAKGLPFVNGWREPAFDDSYPFVKRVDTNTDSIDINEVIQFYDSINADNEIQIKMRKFAEEHYTWEAQFEKVFNSIEANCGKGQ